MSLTAIIVFSSILSFFFHFLTNLIIPILSRLIFSFRLSLSALKHWFSTLEARRRTKDQFKHLLNFLGLTQTVNWLKIVWYYDIKHNEKSFAALRLKTTVPKHAWRENEEEAVIIRPAVYGKVESGEKEREKVFRLMRQSPEKPSTE